MRYGTYMDLSRFMGLNFLNWRVIQTGSSPVKLCNTI